MAKRTPIYECHVDSQARFVDFGGWEMPVRYQSSIQSEHDAVRQKAGLFDVSHMGEIDITGPNALTAANRLFTNDLENISDGQAMYTAMCRPTGGIVDDLVVYRFSRERIFICCNASNRDKDFAWISENLEGAHVVDRGDEFAQLALQGPQSVDILQKLTDTSLADIKRYWFAEGEIAGIPTIFSRTGYTGEDGFELYVPANDGARLWNMILAEGDGIVSPVGLGARDTLRLEMKYALYGNDIDESTTPLEAGLSWVTRLQGEDFIGRDALLAQKEAGIPRRLVAFKTHGKVPARHGYPIVDDAGQTIGHVTSGTRSPTLQAIIGMAYVPTGQHKIGQEIKIQVRNRVETATIVKPPFVTPGSAQ